MKTTPIPPTSFAALLLTGTFLLTGVPRAGAQVNPRIEQGSRVRITAPSARLDGAVGTVQEVTREALVVQFENPRGLGTVDRSAIVGMDVSVRRERRVLGGLGKGLLIGAGGGAVLGLASGDDPPGWLSFSAEEKALMFGVMLGVTGGVVGLIAGAVRQHDIWAAATPGGVDVTLLPLVGPQGAGLHLGFTIPIS